MGSVLALTNFETDDALLTAEDVAQRLRVSKDWVWWFRQLDLAPFDGLIWPHLKACDLLFRAGLGGRSP